MRHSVHRLGDNPVESYTGPDAWNLERSGLPQPHQARTAAALPAGGGQ